VPTVGTSTIETMARSGGKVLVIEADHTIVLDRPQTVALAERHNICIIALRDAGAAAPPEGLTAA
jgi:DUF1009 family protein